MEIADQLKKVMDDLKVPLPELTSMGNALQELMKAQKPINSKQINVDGNKCIIQQFEDKVSIVFPSKELLLNFFNSTDKIQNKQSWFKKVFTKN